MSKAITISGLQYEYHTGVREAEPLRRSFNSLATDTFGLSFEDWYKSGWWQDKYLPHVLTHGGKVVSNVSVNIIDVLCKDDKRRYIQLGTVMTDKEYRSLGLARFLMEAVLEEWSGRCDGIYLYANDSVLDFYPRFGFKKETEHQASAPVNGVRPGVVRLNMDKPADVSLLLERYRGGNPFSALQTADGEGLLMFYCSQYMKKDVYYCEEYDAVIIAGFDGKVMTCYDVFGGAAYTLEQIISAAARPDTERAVFGFTPAQTRGMELKLLRQEDTTMFTLCAGKSVFGGDKLMFPLLSHA